MAMGVTLSEAMSITYARKYNWAVRFADAPSPFSSWFPAISCDLNIGSVLSKDFQIGARKLRIPVGSEAFSLSLSFLDDDNHSLMKWFEAWCGLISPTGGQVVLVSEAVRVCHIVPLRIDKTQARDPYSLWVYPDGDFRMTKGVDSMAYVQECKFHIAGSVGSGGSEKGLLADLENKFSGLGSFA
jgi:hypothetical protein